MPKQVIVVEGENVEKAIERGLNRLGKEREETEIKILQQEQPGLFNQTSQKARVRLAAEGPDLEAMLEKNLRSLLDLLDLGDFELDIEVDESLYRINIDPEKNRDSLLGPQGRTLNATQYLVEQQLNEVSEEPIKVILDSNDFRQKRREDLEKRARYYARQVKESGESFELSPMIETEREVIHDVVGEIEGVSCQNIGEGSRRRVEILARGKS